MLNGSTAYDIVVSGADGCGVAAENILALSTGKVLPSIHDGSGSCLPTVEKGRIILTEFSNGGKLVLTLKLASIIARKSAWLLKKYIPPWVYWNYLLKGREWLAPVVLLVNIQC